MSDGQQLNALGRFRKQPARLVLEEYSHCEVPAGCGGVVLRWRNPLAAISVLLHVYTARKATTLIDGKARHHGLMDLGIGRHVFAARIPEADLRLGILIFPAIHNAKHFVDRASGEVAEEPLRVLSRGDGSWKYTLVAPADESWMKLDFDDSAWEPLKEVPTPQLDWGHEGAYQSRQCAEA